MFDDHLLLVGAAAEDALAGVEEVDAVVLDVEAHQVAACMERDLISAGRKLTASLGES